MTIPDGLDLNTFLSACRIEPSFFVPFVLELDNGKLHNDLQWFLTESPDCYVEIPRGHAKTTQLAGRYAWEIGNNPNIRIKNVGSSDDESKKTVSMVRKIIESDRFRSVFPEIEPDFDNWGNESLTVKRSKMLRDQTIEAVSIFGRAGGRSDLLCFDDICDLRNSIQQPAMRDQVKEFYSSLWLPTLDVSTKGARTWRFATPWHVDDITAQWREEFGRINALFRRPCVGDLSPWPEVFTPEVLAAKRRSLGPIAYARAYELRPVSSAEIVFPTEWLDRSLFRGFVPQNVRDGGQRIASTDFAFSIKTEKKTNPDWSVLLSGIRDLSGTLWVDRLWRVRMLFPDFCKLITREVRTLGIRQLSCEAQGPQSGLVQQVRQECGCTVVDAMRPTDKFSRACEKQPFVEEGKFRLKGEDGTVSRELRPLYDEMTTFPAGDHDDCVDGSIDLITMAQKGGYGLAGGTNRIANVESHKPRLWRFGY